MTEYYGIKEESQRESEEGQSEGERGSDSHTYTGGDIVPDAAAAD
jgi:hypothetical protein